MKRWMMPLAMLACAAAMPAKAQNQGAFSTSYTLEYELKYDRAAEVIKGLAESGHEFARLRLGWLAYLAGRYNEALDHYNLVLRSNPNSLDGRLGLTLPLMAQKRWQDASDQIRQVLAMSPWDYTAHARLLVCQEALKQWSALEQHAREISAVWGSDANALVYLARARLAQNNMAGAKQAYGQVLERLPQHVEALAFMKKNP
jgi:tetratricopeptide (TPR) repeat protein